MEYNFIIATYIGKEFILVNFDELNENDLIATPYTCGSVSPESEKENIKYKGLPTYPEAPEVLALKEIENYLGKQINAVIPTELGGGNTAVAFYTAAMSKKYIIDADPAGRSVPELQHSTYFLNKVPIHPIAIANEFGESAIFTNVVDDYRAEALIRSLAVLSKNRISVVDHINTANKLKENVIKGTISYAWKIGKTFRIAKEKEDDLTNYIIKTNNASLVFKGIVQSNNWDIIDGFTIGKVFIEGIENFLGNKYIIWYKNENIICWKNDEFYITVPDLICVIDIENKEPILNPHYKKGMKVSVFALPAPKEWTTEKALKIFGPKSFGFDINWKSFF